MPGVSSNVSRNKKLEMEEEYDQYQHYFYDDHNLDEDFFKSTAPSEDIWKKFELVPTPPMSPVRILEGTTSPSAGDRFEWVSQFLGQDDEQDGQCKLNAEETLENLSSIIIQDCMWSSFSASQQQLEKVVSERLSCSAQTKLASKAQCVPADSPGLNSLTTDCVDPAAVLTFPLSSSCKKQVSSGSESRTDSSDDEEIDVVTVEHKQNKSCLVNTRKPVTITVRADPYDPCMKRFHISIHQQQHNYAARSPDSYPEDDPPRKKIRQETLPPWPVSTPQTAECKPPISSLTFSAPSPTASACPAHTSYDLKSQPSSPQSSDCEDTDKRKTHNFLERKRRNDLRSRFLALRDEIPSLVDCPKTPKVVILTKATEYLRTLHASDKQKAQEKKRLKSRQQQLLRRLAELKRA
ncbi:protein L-Myc-1b-like [Xyrauchen texanus]|uniref:protein L-Myc-1b-like n=1 Tax=Xyrauchen texanus TaxID=154827 RepID=UPI002241FCCF|nr:protein L-Myc-1b-like [Xyrauchen texanus]